VRSLPARLLTFRARFQYGDRKADGYDNDAISETYWYAPGEATPTTPDPQFTFENHPDTRRFDLTDRVRHLLDVLVTASPLARVDVSASYRYRRDDYDSGVRPSQPLLGYAGALPISEADRIAFSPGDQLGLLDDERHSLGLDVAFALAERVRFNAFASRDSVDARQRGLEYQENNKVDPSAVASTAELGPWTRPSQQWAADIKDTTYTIGLGSAVAILRERLDLGANYTYSEGKVQIEYSGFGTQSAVDPANTLADDFQFGFRSPPTVRNVRHIVGASVGYQVIRNVALSVGYMYERFKLRDWAQEPNAPWFESVEGNEFLLRDTSR
jgi:opacity protein-like surface antigen